MRIIAVQDYEELSKKAANIIAAQVILNPHSVLGLATGSTPVGTYQELIRQYKQGILDFSKVTTINLDEYESLSGKHSQSYRFFMNQNLFDHINIQKEHTFVPNGLAMDNQKECERYEALITQLGGSHLQLLGIGSNGHIGFNEPGESFIGPTHLVALSKQTRNSNSRFFNSLNEVPTHAITMGMRGIMFSSKILLLASGTNKAEALLHAIHGPITPQVPASLLQLHKDVTIIADKDALSELHKYLHI